jgi:hypothetical protein
VKREHILVVGLMLVAAVRVAIYATLLPALTRPDELQHYDRILSAAKGEVPAGVKPLSAEAVGAFVWALKDDSHKAAQRSPQRERPAPSKSKEATKFAPELNHEYCEPPLYYAVAGCWHQLGSAVVWRPSQLPYWDRFLNVLLVPSLVGLGYLVAVRVLPSEGRLIVPTFLALLPQSDLYGVNNDALMPIVFGLFVLAYASLCAKPQSAALSFACGLTLAACAWTKTTSLPLLIVGVLAFARMLLFGGAVPKRGAAFACGLVLAGPLYLWNLHVFGHLTGAFTKMQMQGYTVKPFARWFQHPIFTPTGIVKFWTELTNAYWLGEMPLNHWRGQVLLHAPYLLVWLCPLLTLVVLAGISRARLGVGRPVLGLCWASFVVSVAFLAASSAPIDYGIRPTPTAWWSFPGFVGGRLMIGTLIPFALMTASTCERIKSRRLRAAILLLVLLALNAASAWLLSDAFTGQYDTASFA